MQGFGPILGFRVSFLGLGLGGSRVGGLGIAR